MTPEERREYKTAWAREDRVKNPLQQASYKRQWRACRKSADPEGFLAQEAARMRDYFKDPVRRAKKNVAQRGNYSRYMKPKRRDPDFWRVQIVKDIRARAKKNGIEFDLVAEDIVIPHACPILGAPLVFGGGLHNPDGPSVDRIIPSRGYVKGNIEVISYRANVLKRDCTDPEVFRRIAKYIEDRLSH